MDDMTFAGYISTDFDLDRQIEALVGKKVRGELTPDDQIMLTRLLARRTREMRPSRGRAIPYRLSA